MQCKILGGYKNELSSTGILLFQRDFVVKQSCS